jgi:hypothetical protein
MYALMPYHDAINKALFEERGSAERDTTHVR